MTGALNLEKRNHVKKHFGKWPISGTITRDPYQILSKKKFYYNLYKTKMVDKDSIKYFHVNLSIPQ